MSAQHDFTWPDFITVDALAGDATAYRVVIAVYTIHKALRKEPPRLTLEVHSCTFKAWHNAQMVSNLKQRAAAYFHAVEEAQELALNGRIRCLQQQHGERYYLTAYIEIHALSTVDGAEPVATLVAQRPLPWEYKDGAIVIGAAV